MLIIYWHYVNAEEADLPFRALPRELASRRLSWKNQIDTWLPTLWKLQTVFLFWNFQFLLFISVDYNFRKRVTTNKFDMFTLKKKQKNKKNERVVISSRFVGKRKGSLNNYTLTLSLCIRTVRVIAFAEAMLNHRQNHRLFFFWHPSDLSIIAFESAFLGKMRNYTSRFTCSPYLLESIELMTAYITCINFANVIYRISF